MDTNENLKCYMVVVKITGRCNINCTYCYMYNLGDNSYLKLPKKMSEKTVVEMMNRVREHCIENGINRYVFSLHGGEPLLAGQDFFRMIVAKANEILMPEVTPSFSVQTNGMMINEEWCKTLAELDFDIGISLDGTKEAHDMYRLDFKGNGTYDDVIKGLKIAQESEHLIRKPGVLCVLNIDSDPVEIYNQFKMLGITSIDILLPDYTYDNPPPAKHYENSDHPYADWLIKMFDVWFKENDGRLRVRIFEFITGLILGNDISFDHLGSEKNELLVIETDGEIEAVDVLKACGDGFTKAGANVATHSFNDAMQTDLAKMYHYSHIKVAKKCLACPVKEVCGGGYIPHRYSSKNGFNNPSVYCNDLLKLITHIQNTVINELPEEFIKEMEVEKITYHEALQMIEDEMLQMEEPDYAIELESFKK